MQVILPTVVALAVILTILNITVNSTMAMALSVARDILLLVAALVLLASKTEAKPTAVLATFLSHEIFLIPALAYVLMKKDL